MGCNVHRCRRSYHFKCALESGALLLQDKRLYCCEHRECKQATHHSCVPLSLKPVFRKVTIPLPRRYEKSGLDIPSGQWLRVGGLTVMRLGVTPPSISLPPIGFVACRRLWSTVRAGKTCGYLLRVLADPEAETEAGVEKPMFSLASEDDPEDPIVDPDPQVSPSAYATRIARLNGVTAVVGTRSHCQSIASPLVTACGRLALREAEQNTPSSLQDLPTLSSRGGLLLRVAARSCTAHAAWRHGGLSRWCCRAASSQQIGLRKV